MVIRNILNLRSYIADNNQEKIEHLGKFFAEIIRCVSMSTITLCMTLLNYALIAVGSPFASPHCMISNSVFMYILYKMRILDSRHIKMIEKIKGEKSGIPEDKLGNTNEMV